MSFHDVLCVWTNGRCAWIFYCKSDKRISSLPCEYACVLTIRRIEQTSYRNLRMNTGTAFHLCECAYEPWGVNSWSMSCCSSRRCKRDSYDVSCQRKCSERWRDQGAIQGWQGQALLVTVSSLWSQPVSVLLEADWQPVCYLGKRPE